ncbi:hypothetical protein [Actinophytocola sp.]|uniref:hypothetical protein n=1 Tax=Actinophytocola sp. TaxID=1872138 RepID=UPI0025BCDCCC|nr:hypothetical protein [Actinophytocola sp.]
MAGGAVLSPTPSCHLALAMAESMTRLADRDADVVSDELRTELRTELSKHYTEEQLAALVLWVATTNFHDRLNATIKEPAGSTCTF